MSSESILSTRHTTQERDNMIELKQRIDKKWSKRYFYSISELNTYVNTVYTLKPLIYIQTEFYHVYYNERTYMEIQKGTT